MILHTGKTLYQLSYQGAQLGRPNLEGYARAKVSLLMQKGYSNSVLMYMYLQKRADAERGLELSCACMALLMASTQPKRSASSLAINSTIGESGDRGREGERK